MRSLETCLARARLSFLNSCLPSCRACSQRADLGWPELGWFYNNRFYFHGGQDKVSLAEQPCTCPLGRVHFKSAQSVSLAIPCSFAALAGKKEREGGRQASVSQSVSQSPSSRKCSAARRKTPAPSLPPTNASP